MKVLQRGRMAEGTQRVTWDGTNQNGDIVARGLYFIRVVASGVDQTQTRWLPPRHASLLLKQI